MELVNVAGLWTWVAGKMVILFRVTKRESNKRHFQWNYEIPFNSQFMLEKHQRWNKRPSMGKRIQVCKLITSIPYQQKNCCFNAFFLKKLPQNPEGKMFKYRFYIGLNQSAGKRQFQIIKWCLVCSALLSHLSNSNSPYRFHSTAVRQMDLYLQDVFLQSRNVSTFIYCNSQNTDWNVNRSWSCQCYIQTHRPQWSCNPWMRSIVYFF